MDGGRKNTRGKKRSANDEPMEDVGESGGAKQRGKQLENENEMAFEDPFEDEYEDEDLEGEEEQDDGEDGGDGMDVDMDENENEETQAWLPGVNQLAEGDALEYDSRAYDLIHFMQIEWPCLSFDLLRDGLGYGRQRYPHTIYAVAGSQAEASSKNRLYVMKMSQLHKTRYDDDDSDEDNSDDEVDDEDAVLDCKQITHPGATNRTRALPQQPQIVCTMAEDGKVHLWDIGRYLRALDVPPPNKLKSPGPLQTFTGHRAEGYGCAWNLKHEGRLITSDTNGEIYLWNPVDGARWNIDANAFREHQGSVEDLQWNPAEAEVFASASTDRTIKVWDCRTRNKSVMSWSAHDSDVNVISWNAKANRLIVSGSDDGSFKIWDIRKIQEGDLAPRLNFNWHKKPITSVEWDPNDESSLCVGAEDDTVTLWDIALTPENTGDGLDQQLPTQLLFIHQGQQQIKEAHFHPQVPGLICSTAVDSFCIFKPNITPQEGE